MSSFTASLAAGVPFLEIDIATTRDGALVLMHDDTLDRTTTGSGPTTSRTLAEIQALKLERPDGTALAEQVPLFADVLEWGRSAGAFFELDVKRTTKFADVVNAVNAARMTDRVLVVTYTLDDAKAVHKLDPRLMISVTMEKPEDLEAARASLPLDRVTRVDGHPRSEAGVLRHASRGRRRADLRHARASRRPPGRRLRGGRQPVGVP